MGACPRHSVRPGCGTLYNNVHKHDDFDYHDDNHDDNYVDHGSAYNDDLCDDYHGIHAGTRATDSANHHGRLNDNNNRTVAEYNIARNLNNITPFHDCLSRYNHGDRAHTAETATDIAASHHGNPTTIVDTSATSATASVLIDGDNSHHNYTGGGY